MKLSNGMLVNKNDMEREGTAEEIQATLEEYNKTLRTDRLKNPEEIRQAFKERRMINKLERKESEQNYNEVILFNRGFNGLKVTSGERNRIIDNMFLGKLNQQHKRFTEREEAERVFLENNIEMLLSLLDRTNDKHFNHKVIQQLYNDSKAVLVVNSINRLRDKAEAFRKAYNGLGDNPSLIDLEKVFEMGQDYLSSAYNYKLDKIGSFTAYLLVTHTNMSLSKLSGLTDLSPSLLSKIKKKTRLQELHIDGFITDEEKEIAIKEFKEIAVEYADKYDLSMEVSVEKKVNKHK